MKYCTHCGNQVLDENRFNNEEEKVLVTARFKMPAFFIFLYFFLIAICAIVALVVAIDGATFTYTDYWTGKTTSEFNFGFFIALFLPMFIPGIILIVFMILIFRGIKNSVCQVTNKRIKGVTQVFFSKKNYSYRLDEINTVEVSSTLGINRLVLQFSQGNGAVTPAVIAPGARMAVGANSFSIGPLANAQALYEKLSELLTQIKNDKDLMVDIEKSKMAVENKKAEAFEKMAANMGGALTNTQSAAANSDYISQLKQLNDLLKDGIITQEEFDKKKKKLLG